MALTLSSDYALCIAAFVNMTLSHYIMRCYSLQLSKIWHNEQKQNQNSKFNKITKQKSHIEISQN